VLIALKLLVKDTDSVPKLWVLDVFQAVQSMLVRIKTLLQVINQEVAVAKGSPGWSVVLVLSGYLVVVVDGCVKVAVGGAELGQLVESVQTVLVFHLRHL